MRTPAKRHKDFPIGRICMICGRGGTQRLGGVGGAAGALLALGYVWDRNELLGMAHLPCINRERAAAKRPTLIALPWRFLIDHEERALPTPTVVKQTAQRAYVRLDDPAMAELLDDARHYAHPCGPDMCPPGIIMSAKATVRIIEAALAATK